MHTLIEAARILGFADRRTVVKWMTRAGIDPQRHAHDTRVRLLTDEHIEQIRRYRAAHMDELVAAAPSAIEQRLAALEAEIAALRERSPYLFSSAERPVTPHASVSHDNVLPLHGERQNRSTAARVRPPARGDTFPVGWVSVSTWAERHGLNGRAVDFQIEQGVLPAPEVGRWKRGPNTIKTAYTPEQHAAADRAAAAFWPDRFRPCTIDAATPPLPE